MDTQGGASGEQSVSSVGGAEQTELGRLRRENAQLKAERDLLKNAAAYFAKEAL